MVQTRSGRKIEAAAPAAKRTKTVQVEAEEVAEMAPVVVDTQVEQVAEMVKEEIVEEVAEMAPVDTPVEMVKEPEVIDISEESDGESVVDVSEEDAPSDEMCTNEDCPGCELEYTDYPWPKNCEDCAGTGKCNVDRDEDGVAVSWDMCDSCTCGSCGGAIRSCGFCGEL